jgi:hypothetical protein
MQIAVGSDAGFVWEAPSSGGRRFNDRFHDFLQRRFQAREPEFRSKSGCRIVEALSDAGLHAAALELATRQNLTGGTIGSLLDAHGFDILESAEVDLALRLRPNPPRSGQMATSSGSWAWSRNCLK